MKYFLNSNKMLKYVKSFLCQMKLDKKQQQNKPYLNPIILYD